MLNFWKKLDVKNILQASSNILVKVTLNYNDVQWINERTEIMIYEGIYYDCDENLGNDRDGTTFIRLFKLNFSNLEK